MIQERRMENQLTHFQQWMVTVYTECSPIQVSFLSFLDMNISDGILLQLFGKMSPMFGYLGEMAWQANYRPICYKLMPKTILTLHLQI